jgi:hypothetical protein
VHLALEAPAQGHGQVAKEAEADARLVAREQLDHVERHQQALNLGVGREPYRRPEVARLEECLGSAERARRARERKSEGEKERKKERKSERG